MNTKKLVTTALIIAMGVVSNSIFVIPIGIAKVAPMQHLLNVLTAVWLGPGYAVLQAFSVSLLRNLLGTGTVFAFPGSMIGAICAGLFYARTQKIGYAALGEWIGTGIFGSLVSTLVAQFFMGMKAALDALPAELCNQFRHRSGNGIFHHPGNGKKKRIGPEHNVRKGCYIN